MQIPCLRLYGLGAEQQQSITEKRPKARPYNFLVKVFAYSALFDALNELYEVDKPHRGRTLSGRLNGLADFSHYKLSKVLCTISTQTTTIFGPKH